MPHSCRACRKASQRNSNPWILLQRLLKTWLRPNDPNKMRKPEARCDKPCPRIDRSLSIKVDPASPDGFVVHSFAGDSPIECRDYVRAALGLDTSRSGLSRPHTVAPEENAHRAARVLTIWGRASARPITIARYLAGLGIMLDATPPTLRHRCCQARLPTSASSSRMKLRSGERSSPVSGPTPGGDLAPGARRA